MNNTTGKLVSAIVIAINIGIDGKIEYKLNTGDYVSIKYLNEGTKFEEVIGKVEAISSNKGVPETIIIKFMLLSGILYSHTISIASIRHIEIISRSRGIC